LIGRIRSLSDSGLRRLWIIGHRGHCGKRRARAAPTASLVRAKRSDAATTAATSPPRKGFARRVAIIGRIVVRRAIAAIANQPTVRPSRRPVSLLAGLALAAGVALFPIVRSPGPLPPPDAAQELIVLIRPGPAFYFPGPDGTLAGFDVDLVRQFAAEKKLPLKFALADSAAQVIAAIAKGEAHIGAGGLYRPLASSDAGTTAALSAAPAPSALEEAADVMWTNGFASAQPVLIYNHDGYRPANWSDLDGETVAFVADAGFESEIAAARDAHPGIRWESLALPSVAGVISQVSDGTVGYAIVGSLAASLARNIYLDFDVAFPAGGKREVAWAVPPRFVDLRQELDRFLARLQRDGTLARLADRYMPDPGQIQRIDAGVLQQRMRTVLPQYLSLFHDAQEKSGIEWRLLAAIAYQESQWDPAATSATGVRGIMQITEDTAKHLGIRDLLDPAQNVVAAARYFRDIKAKLPERIHEPDRTWLGLAAFNIGLGHLEDARILAQKQKLDPDRWSDVKKVLPLLAIPEYFQQAKLGYARGGMPVAFVDRVRGYYDVLLAHQPPHRPRLGMFATTTEQESPNSKIRKK
jgi:membrane-bound lytic murein transglycosylase F